MVHCFTICSESRHVQEHTVKDEEDKKGMGIIYVSITVEGLPCVYSNIENLPNKVLCFRLTDYAFSIHLNKNMEQ
jgi:hypothetical protein